MDQSLLDKFTEKYPYSLERLPIDVIDTSWVKTRQCTGDEPNFEGLVSSIKAEGQLQPVLVRRIQEGDVVTLSLIDGNRRLTAKKKLGLPIIDAKVIENCSDRDAMILQLVTNIQAEPVSNAQIRKQLDRISNELSEEELTALETALLIHKTESYVKEKYSLHTLVPELQGYVDSGDLVLSRARVLAKLPAKEQPKWYQKTKDLNFNEFSSVLRTVIRQVFKSKRVDASNAHADAIWTPQPRLRSKITLSKVAGDPEELAKLIQPDMTLEDALREGILFALQMDRNTYVKRCEELEKAKELDAEKALAKERAEAVQKYKELKKELEILKKKLPDENEE
ncbi:MAG: ParB/RepB/Spo0J family partition protein [Candidatus Bathyarchaeia archaeon]